MRVQTRRVYDEQSDTDGVRILVDAMWPRGLTKQRAAIDVWLRDLAPSATLRRWFGHDPARWTEFKARYFHELKHRADVPERVRGVVREIGGPRAKTVTLLFAARDERHNNAVALKEFLDRAYRQAGGAKHSARSTGRARKHR